MRVWRRLRNEPLILISFLVLIAIGTGLLLLPASTTSGQISFIDALFTATSAACVTGLTVVDTGTFFSGFGHFVILLVIQTGGLGIITLSSFFAILLGKKMPLKEQEIVRQTHSSIDTAAFLHLLKRIVLFTVFIEGAGALLLCWAWHGDFPLRLAVKLALFHSISAFCNAGFSLFPDSLIRYQTHLPVNLVVMILILFGGIGFFVIYDIERKLVYRKGLSLHTRIVIATSALLIVAGAALFLLLEFNNSLSAFSFSQKCLIALFQSVTPRTAGFNTIDFGNLTASTLVTWMILMFIGGSPGSTAGGIKTTTFALFLATAYCRFQGRSTTSLLRRTIPEKIVNETFSIILISLVVLMVFNFTMQLTESGSIPFEQAAASFVETNFEVVSAFGTVGLSTGITPRLSFWGKLQLIILMFVGRVGPLVIAVAIGRRSRPGAKYEYYKENVMVG